MGIFFAPRADEICRAHYELRGGVSGIGGFFGGGVTGGGEAGRGVQSIAAARFSASLEKSAPSADCGRQNKAAAANANAETAE